MCKILLCNKHYDKTSYNKYNNRPISLTVFMLSIAIYRAEPVWTIVIVEYNYIGYLCARISL